MSGTSTPSGRPDAHTQKYDRQLRLWASSGQSALENASILVVNASATAASILKNLVLPGIGKFTLLDPALVEGSDVGNNFFLERSSIGKPRAEEVSKFLKELNSEVRGVALVEDLGTILAHSPASLAEYSLILAVDVDPRHLPQLSEIAWERNIPLIKVRSCGFYGSLRTQIRELTIVESHPKDLVDLRIHQPFPALVEYAKMFEYSTLDSEEYAHVPAVVIVIKALEQWTASHDGQAPTTSAAKAAFRAEIAKLKKGDDGENFDEAINQFKQPKIRTDTLELFQDPSCQNLTPNSTNFWILLRAVQSFALTSSPQLLPLTGVLPDMKAQTSRYVELQNIYRTKAKEDLAKVKEFVEGLLKELGLPKGSIADEEIETFVKHAAYLKVVRGRSLKMEKEDSKLKGKVESLTYDPSDDSLYVYLGLESAELFFLQEGRYPGTADTDVDGSADVVALTNIAGSLLATLEGGAVTEWLEKVVKEICRAGGSDLPQIAALLGGLVAQEAIKLVTKQYIPLDGTCIFNGIRSTTNIIVA